jgi:hypothetical protein
MANHAVFTDIDTALLAVFEDLRRREPIFHTPEFGTTLADFERATATEYWEVGASGRRYSRDFILRVLEQNPPIDAASAGWQCSDFGLRRLGPETYLLTYTLRQADRLSRRATVWQSSSEGWRTLYHQGTLVSSEEDDVIPQ